MHTKYRSTVFACCVLVLTLVNLAVANVDYYNYDNNNLPSGPRNYSRYCSFNSDCDAAQNLFCNAHACDCVPNTVYDKRTKECRIMRCDESFDSCPEDLHCSQNVCTKFCDMRFNDCSPEPFTIVHVQQGFKIALIAECAIAAAAIFVSLLVCSVRRCKNRSVRRTANRPPNGNIFEEDDDLLRNEDADGKPSSNVYSFFLCFTGQQPQ